MLFRCLLKRMILMRFIREFGFVLGVGVGADVGVGM